MDGTTDSPIPMMQWTDHQVIMTVQKDPLTLETILFFGADIFHIEEASPNKLLEKFRLAEEPGILGQIFREDLMLLRHGRSRALEGVHFSSLGRYADAELAFQDSDQLLKYEVSVESKLHRTLCYAEHRSRVADWASLGEMIRRAHQIFMDNSEPSAFVLDYFPARFEALCVAASRCIPVDRVPTDGAVAGLSIRSWETLPDAGVDVPMDVGAGQQSVGFEGFEDTSSHVFGEDTDMEFLP